MNSKLILLFFALITVSSYAQEKAQKEIVLVDGWYELDHKGDDVQRLDPFGTLLPINPKAVAEASHFVSFSRYAPNKVAIYFDSVGAEKWRKITKNSIGTRVVFILDNKIFYATDVLSEITGGVCVFSKTKHTEEMWSKLEKIIAQLKEK